MAKLQKISKIALNFLKVFKILAIVILILGIIAPVLLLQAPQMSSFASLQFGDLQLPLAENTKLQVPKVLSFSLLLAYVLSAAAAIWIISLLQKILKPMAEGQPFHTETAPAIRKIAWLHMISALLTQAIGCAVSVFTFQQLEKASISGASLNLQFNLNFLVTFSILFLLSYVFEYGQELQKLSDETV